MSNTRTLNRNNHGISYDGFKVMALYNIHTAAKNIERYVKDGIIKDGKVTGYWPKRKNGYNLMLRGDANKVSDAKQDLEYFTDGWCDQEIDRWGFKTTASAILKRALSCEIANMDLFGDDGDDEVANLDLCAEGVR